VAGYLPLGHRIAGAQPSLDLAPAERSNALPPDAALARLKGLFEDRCVLKVLPDAKGAAHLLRRHGLALAPSDCTMLMSYVLDGGQVDHAIEPLTERLFSHRLAGA